MSFPVSSLLSFEEEDTTGQCDVCEDWRTPCFCCKLKQWEQRFSVSNEITTLVGDKCALEQIHGLEYLSNNLLTIMQPRADGTFAEQSRRPNAPTQNEPLANYILQYGDSILRQSSREMALEIFMHGHIQHNSLPALNVRIMLLMIEFDRDLEALSFVESLSQWPTMRFVEELWLHCRDSLYDNEITENLSVESLYVLILIKTKIIAELKENKAIFCAFKETNAGRKLEQVHTVSASFLGITFLLKEQEQQLNQLCDIWKNEDAADCKFAQLKLDDFDFQWKSIRMKEEYEQVCTKLNLRLT